jgi:hypothetical protein
MNDLTRRGLLSRLAQLAAVTLGATRWTGRSKATPAVRRPIQPARRRPELWISTDYDTNGQHPVGKEDKATWQKIEVGWELLPGRPGIRITRRGRLSRVS